MQLTKGKSSPMFLNEDNCLNARTELFYESINQNPIPGHRRQAEGEVKADEYRSETYAPDRILDEAFKFIDAHKDEPFFLYLPFVEPHVAMQPPQEWIELYPEEWDKEKGAYRGENGYTPHPRPRAAYAAMISDLDEHVGTILDRLDKHGLARNTLVVFTSDNGPTHPGSDPKFHVGGADPEFFNSTASLRGWKGSVYEGGIRVPTIVRWTGKVEPSTTTDAPSYFPDWFPTICRAAGAESPADLDGSDLTPVLCNEGFVRRTPMVWEFHGFGGQIVITSWPWKVVRTGAATNKPGQWELYDLESDPSETTDHAEMKPDILRTLITRYESDRTPNRNFKFPALDD